MGDSDALDVGDWVLAIGNPFNFEQTVSAGIVSGKGRVLEGLVQGQLLQTDASINPGNSGGPLLNLEGDVIGINTAIASRTGLSQGVGFAIPSNRVRWITGELARNGKVRRASIGLRADPLPQTIAEELELSIRSAIYVSVVRKNTPAERAGIQIGDLVTELAGQRVTTPTDFQSIVEQLPPDQPQKIKILRGGQRLELDVTLDAAPDK
jgi:serine protease Do